MLGTDVAVAVSVGMNVGLKPYVASTTIAASPSNLQPDTASPGPLTVVTNEPLFPVPSPLFACRGKFSVNIPQQFAASGKLFDNTARMFK